MLQIRIHGRGGQGVVTAAEMLSIAALAQGRHAPAFPSFGSERTGAPVVALCHRRSRSACASHTRTLPIVQDRRFAVGRSSRASGRWLLLINSKRSFDALGVGEIAQRVRRERMLTVPATDIALKHLGRPLPNAVLLGGFAALAGLVTLDAVAHAIRAKFSGKVADGNVAAATEAYQAVRHALVEVADAQTD